MNERILASILRNPNHSDKQIAKNLRGVTSAQVTIVRLDSRNPSYLQEHAKLTKTPTDTKVIPRAPAPAKKEEPTAGGFRLTNLRVLTHKPAESAAKFIKRLPKGRGYCPKELSQEWGMSEETIKRHARDMSCLKFVEVNEDEWLTLIVSPETAATYNA